MKRFLQRILHEIMKKNDTWNIRRLVDEMIVPSTQRIILKIVGFLNILLSLSIPLSSESKIIKEKNERKLFCPI